MEWPQKEPRYLGINDSLYACMYIGRTVASNVGRLVLTTLLEAQSNQKISVYNEYELQGWYPCPLYSLINSSMRLKKEKIMEEYFSLYWQTNC